MKNPYRELTNDDLRSKKRILSGDNWLDTHIESDVREAVRALRANGVNTIGSCQHDADGDIKYMEIDCLSSNVTTTVNTIRQIFANLNIKNYYVKAWWNSVNGYATDNAMVSIKISKTDIRK